MEMGLSKLARSIMLAVAMTTILASPAFSATINVTANAPDVLNGANGKCSLREAITNINGRSGVYADCAATGAYGTSDTINIPAGTYTNINDYYSTRQSVSIVGASAGSTILHGGGRTIFLVKSGTLSIAGVTITGARASYRYGFGPGATHNGGAIHVRGSLIVTNSTITGNHADHDGYSPGRGGGIYSNSGTVIINNSTITGNTAMHGGGLCGSGITVINSTISGNTAATSGGGVCNGIYFSNTIVANNTAPASANCIAGVNSRGHNLSNDASCTFNATGDRQNTNPLLGALASNGGPTQTMALLSGSPAIDAGACVTGITTDQRGTARPQGRTCDIGAYESAGTGSSGYTVSATAGTGGRVTPPTRSMTSGSTAAFTVTPNTGYTTNTAVGGTCPAGSWSGTTYTTGAITAACSVSFTFAPTGSTTGSLTVTISPAGAVTAGAQWRVDGGAWQASGTTGTLSGLSVGDHTVSFKTVDGFATPADKVVKITSGGSARASGMYKGYTVTAKSSSGGSATPARQVVKTGPTITFKLKPKTGYTTSASVGGTCAAGVLSGTTYTTGAVTANCDVSFTFVKAPTVTTVSAVKITATGATLKGMVNPENDPATVTLKYGLDTTYGTTVSGGMLTGGKSQPASAVVTGLMCGSTYHFRVVAVNSIAPFTTQGKDHTFKTSKCASADSNTSVSPVSDFDGDGKSDILLRDVASGQTAVWMMDGASVASNALTSMNAGIYTSTTGWQAQGVGDFDGDGKNDLLWRDAESGQLAVWTMNGATATSVMVSVNPGAYTSTSGWQIQGIGDFNGDARSDILWRHAVSGKMSVWFMNGGVKIGGGRISSMAGEYTSTTGWQVHGVGDFNGDGKSDILWRHAGTGKTIVWFMNGSAITSRGQTTVQAGEYTSTTGWQVQGVGDFDGDGNSDILWRDGVTGRMAIWMMDGAKVSSGLYTSVDAGAYTSTTGLHVSAIADYNGDGRSDVLLRYAGTGQTYIWLMNGAAVSSDWTSVSPGAYDSVTGLQILSEETIR